jgi:glycosyltransferase involved in cell wall biosynthesis
LNVALTADPEIPVPPHFYGGIERIVDMLATGLEARGHAVTVFAHRDSATAGRLVAWPGSTSRSPPDTIRNAAKLMREVSRSRFDLIHSFSRIAYLAPVLASPIPKLMTYQREISPRTVKWGHALSAGSLEFSAISRWMMRDCELAGRWTLAPNGVPLATYEFCPRVAPDAPLVFLGRLEEIKGPHLAIEIARRAGLPLVIAGNVPEEHREWFASYVAPHIDDRLVRYLGPVDDVAKNRLLGAARAFLMPILWDEPFGIVMAEAMACGTPVLGLNRGAVSEVVEDGVTGFVREDVEGLVEACARLGELDRAACRARVERHYSDDVVVETYLEIYRRLVTQRAGPRSAKAD